MIKEKFIVAIFLISGVVIGNNGNKFCKKMLKLGDVIDKKVDKILEKDSCCKNCNKRSEDYVISGDEYDGSRFPIKNVLTWNIPEVYASDVIDSHFANYWLAPLEYQGHFILKFDQPRTIDTITLVNTLNPKFNNCGTNEFKVYLGETESGPWTEVLHDHLEDARDTDQTVASVPARKFSINPTCAKFVKFQIISWYGEGGGLQYFSTCQLKCEEGWEHFKNKCYKNYSPENNQNYISWVDANFNCNYQRGQLASIPNEETNNFMKNVSATNRTLIGGFATGQGPNPDLWTWTDGTPWSYMNWAPGRPNNFGGPLQEYCLEMNHNQDQIGQWNDIVCIDGFDTSYICQKYPTY